MRLCHEAAEVLGYNPLSSASATATPPGPANRDTSARLAKLPQGLHSKCSPLELACKSSPFSVSLRAGFCGAVYLFL